MLARTLVSRMVQAVGLLVFASLAAFLLVRLAPGDPAALLYGPSATPADLAQFRERWGLDDPLHTQYLRWLSNLLQGDLGRSYLDGRPVLAVIAERVPATLVLSLAALLIASVGGVTVGVLAARRPFGKLDRLLSALTALLYATPPFWFGLMLIFVFSLSLGWMPTGGIRDPAGTGGPLDQLRYLALPALALASRDGARFARLTRSAVLAVLREEYVRTATAKGLSERIVTWRHVLRNALLPPISLIGLAVPGLLSGAVVIETVFSWPGMGRLAIESALQRNYPVVLGEVILVALLALAGSLVADVACAAADPRIRRRGDGR